MTGQLIESTPRGLYCSAGDFYIDPSRAVERAVITHGHSDHARSGSKFYLSSRSGRDIIRARLGNDIAIEGIEFGERLERNGVAISFHPAGHLLGSSQVRIEYKGEVWVVSGDYKVEADSSCEAFEPVRCNTFITESTFALPIYRWAPQAVIYSEINDWRYKLRTRGISAMIACYSLGKAQRMLTALDPEIGPIVVHPTVQNFLPIYEREGIRFPRYALGATGPCTLIAPPQSRQTEWAAAFGPIQAAFISGWMLLRRARRGRSFDRGFAISDHADWDGLLATIEATGAERILVTHGFTGPFVKYLKGLGKDAWTIPTHFEYARGETGLDEAAEEYGSERDAELEHEE